MSQTWIIYTLISGFGSVAFNFISRKVLRDGHDSTAYSWWFESFRLVIFLPFILFSLDLILPIKNMILFFVIGLGEFFAIYFYMKMHSQAELSVSSLVMQLRLILVPLIAFIVLNEKLSINSYIGIIVILIGQIIALSKKNTDVRMVFTSAVKISLITTTIVSLNNVLIKSASQIFTPQLVSVAMALPSVFLFPILMKSSKPRLIKLGNAKGKNILLAALVNAVAMFFLVLAFKIGPVGKVTALHQSVLMFQVLMGILFLNEKENIFQKIIGAVVVIMGVIFLI